jgi:hypothetical protein
MLSRWIVRFTGVTTLCMAVCAAASAQYGGGGGTGGSGGTGGTGGYTAPPGGYSSGKAIGIGVGAAAGAAVGIRLLPSDTIITLLTKHRPMSPAALSPFRTESV